MQSKDNNEDETDDDNCDNCWCLWQGIAQHVKQRRWWWWWIYRKSGHYVFYLHHPWEYLLLFCQLLHPAPNLKVDKTKDQANHKSTDNRSTSDRILSKFVPSTAIDHILLIGRHYIYSSKLARTSPSMTLFKGKLNFAIEMEKQAALLRNSFTVFSNKWKFFLI